MAQTIKDSYTPTTTGTLILPEIAPDPDYTAYAQSFTVASGFDIGQVKLRLLRVGSPGTITVGIYATTAGLPTGGTLISGTTNGNTLTTNSSGGIRTIVFASTYSLSTGVQYAIVITAPSGDENNYVGVRIKSNGTYADGKGLYYDGTWRVWENPNPPGGVPLDLYFSTWELIYANKATTPDPADDDEEVSVDLAEITWVDGGGGTQFYDVYFGPVGDMSYVAFNAVGNESYSIPSQLDESQEYEWRVDSYNGSQLTTGDTWSFTTTAQRQINLSSPANTATGIILQPLLQWTISGIGAQEGDLLDIYIKKDDSDFSVDDRIGSLVDATLNSSLQIVAGLEYNSTYYWQVQAANSAGGFGTLLTSPIWSFTTTTFRPPAVPIGGNGEPIGINNMLTRKRFIAAANNKIWYEDI